MILDRIRDIGDQFRILTIRETPTRIVRLERLETGNYRLLLYHFPFNTKTQYVTITLSQDLSMLILMRWNSYDKTNFLQWGLQYYFDSKRIRINNTQVRWIKYA